LNFKIFILKLKFFKIYFSRILNGILKIKKISKITKKYLSI